MLKTIPEAAVPSDRVLKTPSTFAVDMFESVPELKHDEGLPVLFIHMRRIVFTIVYCPRNLPQFWI